VTFLPASFKGEDHWLSHGETRVRMLQELEKFLAAQLHP
jgi:dipeptidyl aminopeptidase/acylaminoacyl peptidase